MRARLRIAGIAIALVSGLLANASAQTLRGIVVDQTGLPLPGATIELTDGTTVAATVVSGPDGSFEIPVAERGSMIVVRLQGFETVSVSRLEASRVMLTIARAAETTDVVAPLLPAESPVAPLLGNSLSATDIARMPSAHLQARESLPLLPSVVRGPDGLLRLGGARPSESPLFLDGFDVTDPATGMSSINLPFEAVQGVELLRDPTAVTYGGLLGGLVKLESRPGGDTKQMGLQGFVPRPRFQNPGFGRIEGIFPRFYVGGKAGTTRVRYFGAVEYDFERITVPEVTQGSGPNIVEQSASVFARLDVDATPRTHFVIEGLAFPSGTDLSGLSPRREELAAPNIRAQDLFAGVTGRTTLGQATLLTVRVGVLSHDARLVPGGTGPARLSPQGWRGNWFSRFARDAVRYGLSATLERTLKTRRGSHDVTLLGSFHAQRLHGSVTEAPVTVENDAGAVVRTVDFDRPRSFAAHDWPYVVALRDVWHASNRFQMDGGVRMDGRHGVTPSARAGVRYEMDEAGLTVVKGAVGSFVGNLPLAVAAFSDYPVRTDWRLNEATGREETLVHFPRVDRLRLPHAVAFTLQLERQLRPGLDAQVGFTRRRSTRVATLDVPEISGPLAVSSTGTGEYREFQASVRQTWGRQQQVFLSYVRSSSRGELNDFMALFTGLGAPLLQPGGMSRLTADARHRWIAWGTVNLPGKIVASPVMEWHSGFPYSALDSRQLYFGEPNSAAYPAFLAVDLIAYKTVTFRERVADVGIQLFNLTNHHNPRDVYSVVGTRSYGTFTNSVGPILRGFMMIKW